MNYDFDEAISRKNTQCSKWDNVGARVGNPDSLPMWVADTDFRCPEPVVEALRARVEHMIYGYPYVPPEFAMVTAEWLKRRHGYEINPEWVLFSCGVVPVISTMIQAFSDVGDEVIIQEPVYHPFRHAIEDNGRVISNNALIYRDYAYTIDFEDLERRAASRKAKLMIVSSPHNPVGRVWTPGELLQIAEICHRNRIIVVCDEIHSDVMLFGNKHTPMAMLNSTYAENIVTCYSPSKTFNIAGIRASGIVVQDEGIRKRLAERFNRNRSVQQNVFAIPAYIAAYTACDDYLVQLLSYLEGNVRFVESFLGNHMPQIKLVKPQATFLVWLDCSETGLSGDPLADFIINKARVAVSRGDGFGPGGEGFVRMNIGCPRQRLSKGLNQILDAYQRQFS